MYNIDYIENMKKHCSSSVFCCDSNKDNMCQYRNTCLLWINGGHLRHTPAKSNIKDMYNFLNGKCKKQVFYNDGSYCRTTKHPCRNSYSSIKQHHIIKHKCLIKDEWLNIQNFARWWDLNVPYGYGVRVKKGAKIINEKSLIIYRK